MKNRDLVNSTDSVNSIAAIKDLPIPLSFAIGLNLKALKDYLDVFEAEKKKLIDKHTVKDAEGKPIPQTRLDENGKPVLGEDGRPETIPGSLTWDDSKALDADFKILLDLEAEGFKPRRIKISKLKDAKGVWLKGIDPADFASASWMFLNDIQPDVNEYIESV